MKSKWERKLIEDICEKASSNIAQKNLDGLSGNYPVYGASGYIQNVDFYQRDTEYIGIVKDGSGVGRVNTYPAYSSLLGTMQYILPKKGYSLQFVAYALKSLNLASFAAGAAIPHIYFRDYGKCEVSVPPLDEQQRIVAELDLLTEVIDKQKTQLKELDTLAQSIFYDMFGDPIENEKGWSVKKISDVATVKIGPFGSLLHAKDYVKGGHPVINPIHLDSGRVVADDSFTVDETMFQQMLSYELKVNDVVFGRRGDIGRCALVEKEQIGYLCGTGSLFIRFSETIEPKFSIAALMHRSITEYLLKKAKGATMLNINCGIVEDIPLILPPIKLQQEFADKIQSIEKQKAAVNQSIVEIQKLLDYTMDKYFG